MEKILFHHHLGLGDHFICNGLVHALFKKMPFKDLLLLTKEHNLPTVECLYQAFPHITPIVLPKDAYEREDQYAIELSKKLETPLLKVSYSGAVSEHFDKSFYQQLGIDFNESWDSFHYPINTAGTTSLFKKLIGPGEYCLASNAGSIGKFHLKMNTCLPVYYIDPSVSKNLLDWQDVIINATELHCIDSSVIHLADRLPIKAKKLVYHDVGRGSKFHLKNTWLHQSY